MSAQKMWYAVVDKDGALTMCDDDNECQHHARWQNQNKHAAIFAPHRAVTLVEWQPWMDVPGIVRAALDFYCRLLRDGVLVSANGPVDQTPTITMVHAWLAALPPITTGEQ